MTEERNLNLLADLLRDIKVSSFGYVTGKCCCRDREVLFIAAKHV